MMEENLMVPIMGGRSVKLAHGLLNQRAPRRYEDAYSWWFSLQLTFEITGTSIQSGMENAP